MTEDVTPSNTKDAWTGWLLGSLGNARRRAPLVFRRRCMTRKADHGDLLICDYFDELATPEDCRRCRQEHLLLD